MLPHQTICAEIDTSPLEVNKPDGRENSSELPQRIVELDPTFEARLRVRLEKMKLTAGFFECNTNARWQWIQQVTG